MTERVYMVVSNLTRIRNMKEILRMVDVDNVVIFGESHQLMAVTLAAWELKYKMELENLMKGQDG